MKIKINFVDFWEKFDKTNNFFHTLLSKKYVIEISERPDFLFYSCYGNDHLNYKCIRIFYGSENQRPDFLTCDYAIGFDFFKRKNYLRFPLFQIYIALHDYFGLLSQKRNLEEIMNIWKKKVKFCCMVVSNPNSKERIDFFNKLTQIKHVDSGGRHLNNIGYFVEDKMEFIKDYKFIIAFENSSYPGYTTEKILEPLVADCIPIYWGNPLINADFNEKCFIDASKFDNYDELISRIIQIDQNNNLAYSILLAKNESNIDANHLKSIQELNAFLDEIFTVKKKLPVAQNKFFELRLTCRRLSRKLTSKINRKFA
ncbi:MAG: glycosyltransferase [Bacteroidetes bacterium]|nr:glycosyltransferase [Bacteroidota bacterium]